MQHFKFVNWRIRFLMSRTGYIMIKFELNILICCRLLCIRMETSLLCTSKHITISAPIQMSIYTMISLKLELVMVLFKMVPCTCITRFRCRRAESRLYSSHVFTNPESTNFSRIFLKDCKGSLLVEINGYIGIFLSIFISIEKLLPHRKRKLRKFRENFSQIQNS